MELHELHRRRLEATLKLLEDGLDRIERLLAALPRESVEDALAPRDVEGILEGVRQFRSALQDFATEFRLERHPLGVRQVLNAELSSAWVVLENCRPKRMKGYGVPFTPEHRAHLEGRVEQLLAHVLKLRKHVR